MEVLFLLAERKRLRSQKKRGRPKGEAKIKPAIPSSNDLESEHLLVLARYSGDTAPGNLPEFHLYTFALRYGDFR